MVDTETNKCLKDVKQEGDNFIISHTCNIERVTEEVISGSDLKSRINVLETEINEKTVTYNLLGEDLDVLSEEFDKLQEVGVEAGLLDEGSGEESNEESENSEE